MIRKQVWEEFEIARQFARTLGLTEARGWFDFCKTSTLPDNIPTTPQIVYSGKGWNGWRDFLGTGYLSFPEAREFAQSLDVRTNRDWRAYLKSGQKPKDIPANPETIYSGKGWDGWTDFLTGAARTSRYLRYASSYGSAVASHEEWRSRA